MSPTENVQPERALVSPDAVRHYQQEMSFFASTLVELNVNIYIVERILDFPVDLFLGAAIQTIFLGQVVDNFLNASLLLIDNLVDTGHDIHSLRYFRDRLMREWIKPEYRDWLASRLGEVNLRQRDDELLRRLKHLRNHRIAHILHDFAQEVFEQRAAAARVDFAELKLLRDELNTLLDAMALDTEYLKLPLSYEPGESDIEEFLDGIARNSSILNMPEQNPEGWTIVRSSLDHKNLERLNEYRRKFCKEPA